MDGAGPRPPPSAGRPRHQVTGLGHRVGQEVVDEPGHLHGDDCSARRIEFARASLSGSRSGRPGRARPDRRQRAPQVVRGRRGEADQRTQPVAVLRDLAEHQQHARTGLSSPGWSSSTRPRHGHHEVVARSDGSWTSPTPSSARTAPVCDASGLEHQLHQPCQGFSSGAPGSTRWARRRLAPLLRSMRPCRSRTMSPSSMLSVISASSSACSAAVARARAIRPTSSSIRSPRVPTASPVSSTRPGRAGRQRPPARVPWRLREGPGPASVSRRPPTPSASGVQGREEGREPSGRPHAEWHHQEDDRQRLDEHERHDERGDHVQGRRARDGIRPARRGATSCVYHSHARWPTHPTATRPVELPAEPSLERPRAPDVHPGQPHADAAEGGAQHAAHRCGGAGPRERIAGRAEARGPSGAEEGRAPAASSATASQVCSTIERGPEDDQGCGRARDRGDRERGSAPGGTAHDAVRAGPPRAATASRRLPQATRGWWPAPVTVRRASTARTA